MVSALALSSNNMYIMSAMMALVVLLPVLFMGKTNKKIVPIYLSGVSQGDDLTYTGSMEKDVTVTLRNWYMESYFGERKMNVIGVSITTAIIVVTFAILLGGVL